jgi:hypothetical protein
MTTCRPLGDAGELSLMEHSLGDGGPNGMYAVVDYVHWTNVAAREGRIVKTRNGAVVYSMPYLFPKLDFTGSTVIHPAVGVRMYKVAAGSRPGMPDSVERLKRMWTIAAWNHANTDESMVVGVDGCLVCGKMPTFDGECAFTCPMCCCTFHNDCCQELLRFGDFAEAHRKRVALPPTFFDESKSGPLLCALCKHNLDVVCE